jgi:predicted PurR-regulated permease PerM
MVQKEITFDKFIRWTGIILLIVFILYAVNYLSAVLIPFFVAWVFAYLLYPIVKFIENKLHVRIRALSIILTFIVVIAALSLLVYLLIPPMIEQFG